MYDELAKKRLNEDMNVQTDENGRRYIPTMQALKFMDDRKQQSFNNAITESAVTGRYVRPEVEELARKVLDAKQAWNDPTKRTQAHQDADIYRNALRSYGVDADNLFGAKVNAQQATGNLQKLGQPTMAKQQFDRGIFESNRNYNRGVLESDRNYDRGVIESDRNYDRGVLESDRNYDRGVLESDRDYNLKQEQELSKLLEGQNEKMKGEVSGLLSGLRSGELTPQQAHNMIQQDLRAGQYTPEEADQLERVLNDYYYTTPPEQGGAFGPPNLSGFNNWQKGGENPGANSFKNIISSNEGSYHSVNPNDNGALSIGKFQWHGNRAREIVQSIKTNDPATYHAVTGGQLDLSKSWDKKILNNRESLMISKLLNTQTGISVQDQIAARDLNGYIQKGRSLGIRDQGALSYFVDLYNQSPARAVEIAKRSDGSLRSLHQNAMIDPIMSKYKSRRESTYQKSMGV